MKQKWIFTGAAFALAMALNGCGDNAAASIPQQSSQEQAQDQPQMIRMEEAQEAALKAADIEAADADISATTLSEAAGVACYKVEFTSGEYAYAYTVNAETGTECTGFRDADGGGRLCSSCPCPGTDVCPCYGTDRNRYRNCG